MHYADPPLVFSASTWACRLCMRMARPLSWVGFSLLRTTEMCRICCLLPSAASVVPSVMPSKIAAAAWFGSAVAGKPDRPDGWPSGPTTGRMCGLGTG